MIRLTRSCLHHLVTPLRLRCALALRRACSVRGNSAACLLAVLIFSGGCANIAAAQARSPLVGQWQGSLEGKPQGRILLQLEPRDGSEIQGVVYLLDEDNPAWPHATSAFTLQGSDLSFRITNLDVSYVGKLDADGALAGVWKQHGAIASIKLVHVSGDAAWPVPASEDKPMPLTADPAFDIATIKPADPKDTGSGFQLRGARLHVRNESLEDIVTFAYGIHRGQIQGAPAWFASERWEIDGLADTPGAPNLKQMRTMYRKLLAERFALKLDRQKRELPVYLLVMAQDKPKLTRSLGDPNGPPDSTGNSNKGVHDFRYTDIDMDEFAQELAFGEDRPVVNATRLDGRYDFRLRWTSTDMAADSQNAGTDAPPVLFTAIREQLGLSLKTTRAPAEVYVIAHVEKPSAN